MLPLKGAVANDFPPSGGAPGSPEISAWVPGALWIP
jgi:hypothetical protein